MARAIRFLSVVGLWAAIVPAAWAQGFCPANPSLGPSVGQWQRWEQTLTSTQDYVGPDKRGNPYKDLKIRVTFKSCDSGATFQSYGFWYGVEKSPTTGALVDSPRSFRIRGSFQAGGQTGNWQWQTTCSGKTTALTSANQPVPDCTNDSGLNQTGYFKVTAGGTNALYRGGLLSLSEDRRYLTYAKTYTTVNQQGQQITQRIPFFWLGDTAWNAPITTTQSDWQTYINDRVQDSTGRPNTAFTVVQIAVSPKAAGPTDTNNNPPFDLPPDPTCAPDTTQAPHQCSSWNPRYWAGMDDKIQYANQQGLLVLLVGIMEPLQKDFFLLASPPPPVTDSPGLVTLARNLAGRYFGNFVVFSPGFDHMIPGNFSVIREVGQTLHNNTRNLVTNHPAGGSAPGDLTSLQNESWLDFQMYQSGTPGNTQTAERQNMTSRASSLATTLQAATPIKSAINGEATYDGVSANPDNHTPYRARQTAFLSFFGGAMGYSAGTCGVTDWGRGIGGCPVGLDWRVQMTRRTSRSMRYLRYILQTINWQRLHPDSNRILNQAPEPDKKMIIADDPSSVIVAYLPDEQSAIQIDFGANNVPNTPKYQAIPGLANLGSKQAFLTSGWVYRWFSPRTGNVRNPATNNSDLVYLSTGKFKFTKPTACDFDQIDIACDKNDWVLRLTKSSGPQPPPPASAASHLEVSSEIGSSSGSPAIVAQRIDDSTGLASSYLEMGWQGVGVLGSPRVAFGPSGNTMLIWERGSDDGTTVTGRVLDPASNPLAGEFAINSEATMAPEHPSIASLQDGTFVVTWKGMDNLGGGPWIWYRRFDSGGSPLGPELVAMNCELVPGDFPQVTASGFGGFYVAWEMDSGAGIHYVEFDADANPTGQEGTLAQGSTGWPVLDTIDGSDTSLTVSWNVYGSDSTQEPMVTGSTLQVVPGAPIVCR